MVWSAARAAISRLSPAASIRLTTAGVTLSLNRNCSVFGGCATTLPSAGSAATSVAWASAPVATHSATSSTARPAMTRVIEALRLRHQLDARRRRLAAMSVALALPGNIDPAADPLLALLHHRKIQRAVRLQ